MVEDVMSDWKSVKESKPKKDQVVVFLQLSTGKYFAGYLESEIVHGENSYFWVTATGHCKDMKEDDFWLSFPCYEGYKVYF